MVTIYEMQRFGSFLVSEGNHTISRESGHLAPRPQPYLDGTILMRSGADVTEWNGVDLQDIIGLLFGYHRVTDAVPRARRRVAYLARMAEVHGELINYNDADEDRITEINERLEELELTIRQRGMPPAPSTETDAPSEGTTEPGTSEASSEPVSEPTSEASSESTSEGTSSEATSEGTTEPVSEPTSEATSEPTSEASSEGTAGAGNMYSESGSGYVGYANVPAFDLEMGSIDNPVNGYTVLAILDQDLGGGSGIGVLVMDGELVEPASFTVTVEGLGSLTYYLAGAAGGVTQYVNAMSMLGLQPDTWYTVSLSAEAPTESEATSEATSEGTSEAPAGNLRAATDGWDIGYNSFSDMGTVMGQAINPINGYTVTALRNSSGFATFLAIPQHPDNPESITISAPGLDPVTVVKDSPYAGYDTYYNMDDPPIGFVADTWYDVTLTPAFEPSSESEGTTETETPPPPTETESEGTPVVPTELDSETGNLLAVDGLQRTGYWQQWDEALPYTDEVDTFGVFHDRDTALPGWKVIAIYDRYGIQIWSPEVELMFGDITEGWEPPTGGTEWEAAPETLYVRVTGPSLTEGPNQRTFTLPWKYRSLVRPFADVYGFAGTGFYDLFEFREGEWYLVELSFDPFTPTTDSEGTTEPTSEATSEVTSEATASEGTTDEEPTSEGTTEPVSEPTDTEVGSDTDSDGTGTGGTSEASSDSDGPPPTPTITVADVTDLVGGSNCYGYINPASGFPARGNMPVNPVGGYTFLAIYDTPSISPTEFPDNLGVVNIQGDTGGDVNIRIGTTVFNLKYSFYDGGSNITTLLNGDVSYPSPFNFGGPGTFNFEVL